MGPKFRYPAVEKLRLFTTYAGVIVVQLALTLLTSPQISPEMQTGERQQLLRDRFGHLRRDVCSCFRKAWEGPVGTVPRTYLTLCALCMCLYTCMFAYMNVFVHV